MRDFGETAQGTLASQSTIKSSSFPDYHFTGEPSAVFHSRMFLVTALFLAAGSSPLASATEKDEQLLEAARAANLVEVTKLLDEGANVNAVVDKKTPLIAATLGGSAEVVQALIDAGADVNAEPDRTRAVNLAISRKSDIAVLRALVEADADLNFKGSRALKSSAYYRRADAVRLLIDAGADVNLPALGDSPLTQVRHGDGCRSTKFFRMSVGLGKVCTTFGVKTEPLR